MRPTKQAWRATQLAGITKAMMRGLHSKFHPTGNLLSKDKTWSEILATAFKRELAEVSAPKSAHPIRRKVSSYFLD